MFLEGFVEYTIIFTDDKEPVLFVDSIPKLNHGEAMLTFALVGSASPEVFNVSYNGVTNGPWSVNDITPHYVPLACCGSVSLLVGQTDIQFPAYETVRDKVTRVIIVNGAVVLQKLATSCGQIIIRVVNALLAGPAAIRIATEGTETALVDQIGYGNVTEYLVFGSAAGLYRFVVTDQNNNYMFTSCARLNGGTDHTIIAIGDETAKLKLWTLEDDNIRPAQGEARVRAVFAIPDIFDQHEIVLKASIPSDRFVFPTVNYQTVTDYLNFPSGNYSVRLLSDSQVLGTVHKPQIPAGSVVSLFVLGSADDRVLDILVSIDAQYPDEEPVIPAVAPIIEAVPQEATPVRPRTPGVTTVPMIKVHDSAAHGLRVQSLMGAFIFCTVAFLL
jgi:hypothetical protein